MPGEIPSGISLEYLEMSMPKKRAGHALAELCGDKCSHTNGSNGNGSVEKQTFMTEAKEVVVFQHNPDATPSHLSQAWADAVSADSQAHLGELLRGR